MHAWYLYCLNDPLNFIDPDGLKAADPGPGAGGGGNWESGNDKPKDDNPKDDKPTSPPNNDPIVPHPTAPSNTQQDIEAQNQANAAAAARAEMLEKQRKQDELNRRRHEMMMKHLMEGECVTPQQQAQAESIRNWSTTLAKINWLMEMNKIMGWGFTDAQLQSDLNNLSFFSDDKDSIEKAYVGLSMKSYRADKKAERKSRGEVQLSGRIGKWL